MTRSDVWDCSALCVVRCSCSALKVFYSAIRQPSKDIHYEYECWVMKRAVCLLIPGCVLICCCVKPSTETTCPHPDVPENGNFSSKQSDLEPGVEITYSCKNDFALFGEERRICKSDGHWSGHTPFCDPATQIKYPIIRNSKEEKPWVLSGNTVDGRNNTCSAFHMAKDGYIKMPLLTETIIHTVKIFYKAEGQPIAEGIPEGLLSIQVFTEFNQTMTLCGSLRDILDTDQWIIMKCENNSLADLVRIIVTEDSIFILCEFQVYGKTSNGCEQSPNSRIPRGHSEVSRSKVKLICEDGFKTHSNDSLVCEGNNTWIGGPLACEEEDATRIRRIVLTAVAVIVLIIIIASLAAIICYRRKHHKSKENSVVFRP